MFGNTADLPPPYQVVPVTVLMPKHKPYLLGVLALQRVPCNSGNDQSLFDGLVT